MSGQNVTTITGMAQDISIKYQNDEFINTEVLPFVDLQSPSQKITTYLPGQQFQSGASARAPGTKIATTMVERGSVQADTIQYATSDIITREDMRDAGLPGSLSPPIDLVQDALENNAKDLDLRREIEVADFVFATTWAASTVDVAGSWLTAATSTFLADFDVGIGVLKRNGVNPRNMRLMLDWGTFQAIKRIDDMENRLNPTGRDTLNSDLLAKILEIGKVVVGGSIQNTAAAISTGDAMTGAYIWESNAAKGSAFLYAYETPKRKSLNAGVQPRSKLDNKQYRISESYWDNERKGFVYDSMEETDVLATATDAGYLWNDTILT